MGQATGGRFQGRRNREHEPEGLWPPGNLPPRLFYLFGLVYILEGEPHCATNHLIPLLSSSPQSIPGTKPFLSLKWVP